MNPQKNSRQYANKEVFERLYRRELSKQELFEIQRNMIGFFETLIKLDKKIKDKQKL
ncbi:MAG: hypothetical protein ACD_19C00087G0003 [uncultured bacterium]|nr:MAG: hypothetical protein ACD_19C00087G0003 [uncultured bacterium]